MFLYYWGPGTDQPCRESIHDITHYHWSRHSTTKLLLDLLWPSSLQHVTSSGVKVRLVNCLVTSNHWTAEDEWKHTGCCYSVWSVFTGDETPCLIYFLFLDGWWWWVMWSWYAVEHHPALKLWHAVTSLTSWLLKKACLYLELLALVDSDTE